jgi:hypothetical protein
MVGDALFPLCNVAVLRPSVSTNTIRLLLQETNVNHCFIFVLFHRASFSRNAISAPQRHSNNPKSPRGDGGRSDSQSKSGASWLWSAASDRGMDRSKMPRSR